MDNYNVLFKRKSFHLYRNTLKVSEDELKRIQDFIQQVKPLDGDIKTEIRIVKEKDTHCKRGAEYCVVFYSEPKQDYLRNIGYIGEQIDLYLTSLNMGTLWFGMAKEKDLSDSLKFVIMMAFSKVEENTFRKDVFKAKRKAMDEILSVYRYKKANKRGIMPINKVMYYNQIDMGIFLFIFEVCLNEKGIHYERILVNDVNDSDVEKTLCAQYKLR